MTNQTQEQSGGQTCPALDIAIEGDGWGDPAMLEDLVMSALAAASVELELAGVEDTELSLVLTDDEAVRALNAQWRGKDKSTNVLSFPAFDIAPGAPLPPALGDIVVARETVEREAALDDKRFDHHLSHLVVHGFLHLLGYDHEDDVDAELMEGLERRILARLGIADPYGEPSSEGR